MPSIYQVAKRQRKAVREMDARALAKLAQAYGAVYERIEIQLQRLLGKVAEAKALGITPSIDWLLRQERYEALLDQVALSIRAFGGIADKTILNGQAQAVEDALRHSGQLVATGTAGIAAPEISVLFNRVPVEALQHLVGFLGDGSPLRTVTLGKFGPQAVYDAQRFLQAGLGAGLGSREIGRELRDALGSTLYEAQRISRTEVLRSYRSASQANYEANSDVVEAMIRIETLDERTCPVCWFLHGTEEPLGTEYGSHVNCRGTWVPKVVGKGNTLTPGAEQFEKADEAKQLQILGPAKFEAFLRGDITLESLVRYRDDPRWGPGRTEKSLEDALAA